MFECTEGKHEYKHKYKHAKFANPKDPQIMPPSKTIQNLFSGNLLYALLTINTIYSLSFRFNCYLENYLKVGLAGGGTVQCSLVIWVRHSI